MVLPYEIRYETEQTAPGRRTLRVWKGSEIVIDLEDVPQQEAAIALGELLIEYSRYGRMTRFPRERGELTDG